MNLKLCYNIIKKMSGDICQQDLAKIIKGTHAGLRMEILQLSARDEVGEVEKERLEDDIWSRQVLLETLLRELL